MEYIENHYVFLALRLLDRAIQDYNGLYFSGIVKDMQRIASLTELKANNANYHVLYMTSDGEADEVIDFFTGSRIRMVMDMANISMPKECIIDRLAGYPEGPKTKKEWIWSLCRNGQGGDY